MRIMGYWNRKWKIVDYNREDMGLYREDGKENGNCQIIIG